MNGDEQRAIGQLEGRVGALEVEVRDGFKRVDGKLDSLVEHNAKQNGSLATIKGARGAIARAIPWLIAVAALAATILIAVL